MNAVALTIYSIVITIATYMGSRALNARYASPVTNIVFLSMTVIIAILLASGIDTTEYRPAKEIMTYLLGPATVALAVPLYNNRAILLKNLVPAGVGLICGSLASIFVAIFITQMFHLSELIQASLSVKNATAPIAIEITKIIGGDPALTAVFVVATGFVGSMLGPWMMDKTGISLPLARGLSLGTISHGQGTAQAVMEGELQGAIAGVAMGVSAIFTSIFIPNFITFFM